MRNDNIEDYKAKRAKQKVGKTGRRITPRSANVELKCLRRVLGLCVRPWKYLKENVALDVKLLPDPEKESKDRVLEEHEEPRGFDGELLRAVCRACDQRT